MSSDTARRLSSSPSASVTLAALRAVATTLSPAVRAAFAMSMPMPRAAPVMNQVLSAMCGTCVSRRRVERLAEKKSGPGGVREFVHRAQPLNRRAGDSVSSPKHRSAETGSPCQRATDSGSQTRPQGPTLDLMDTKNEIRAFLTSRRGRVTPEQAGLPSYGARRVPGLRREEVAVLAGVSIQYYTRLERGDLNGVSESVLEGLARALALDDAERAHLIDLARATNPMPARPRRRPAKHGVRSELQWTLDAITGAAAFIGNDRLDVLAANQLGRALYSQLYEAPVRPVNTARFVFLDPR